MNVIKFILWILLVMVLLIAAVLLWLKYSPRPETINTLTKMVSSSQTRYFCKVFYPQISGCVNFSPEQCPAIVSEQVNPCIKDAMADVREGASFESLHTSINRCVSPDLQRDLLRKHFTGTPECKARFGF